MAHMDYHLWSSELHEVAVVVVTKPDVHVDRCILCAVLYSVLFKECLHTAGAHEPPTSGEGTSKCIYHQLSKPEFKGGTVVTHLDAVTITAFALWSV